MLRSIAWWVWIMEFSPVCFTWFSQNPVTVFFDESVFSVHSVYKRKVVSTYFEKAIVCFNKDLT